MSKPTQPPADHPIDENQMTISGPESADETLKNAEESSDRLAKPNLEDIRTAGF